MGEVGPLDAVTRRLGDTAWGVGHGSVGEGANYSTIFRHSGRHAHGLTIRNPVDLVVILSRIRFSV